MTTTLYNYSYNSPDGYSYKGQVVADTEHSQYNYVSGQTYASPNGGTYEVYGDGETTSAPPGAVYQTSYTNASGTTYDSYHYDVKNASYYDINNGYDHQSGMYAPKDGSAPVPAWSGIGLGNEYSYVNTGSPTAPDYHTYGGGGSANVNWAPSPPAVFDYKFLYQDGNYYVGKVVDDGTYGYDVGQSYDKGNGTYSIYNKEDVAPGADPKAGYNYVELYHDVSNDMNYAPSDIMPGTPLYNKPAGYGGLSTEHDWIQKPGGYYGFDSHTSAMNSPAVNVLPLPT